MKLIISSTGGTPIYEQLQNQLRAAIMDGELGEGDALPSIRSLAKDLKISVITTKRAYDELEKEGFITTVQGKGCFVAGWGGELAREQLLRELDDAVQRAAGLARRANIPSEELVERIVTCYGRERRK